MAVLTEYDVRQLLKEQSQEITIERGTIITPSAKSLLSEKDILVSYASEQGEKKELTLLSEDGDVTDYFDNSKSEVRNLVLTNFPLQQFIGKLRTLQGEVLQTQFIAREESNTDIIQALQLVLGSLEEVIESVELDTHFYEGFLDSTQPRTLACKWQIDIGKLGIGLFQLACLANESHSEFCQLFLDISGKTRREDLFNYTHKLPHYIYQLIDGDERRSVNE